MSGKQWSTSKIICLKIAKINSTWWFFPVFSTTFLRLLIMEDEMVFEKTSQHLSLFSSCSGTFNYINDLQELVFAQMSWDCSDLHL